MRILTTYYDKLLIPGLYKKKIMLKISNITKEYQNCKNIITNFSLNVENGDFVALMGSNGSGKTTLFNVISKLESCTTGQITYNGQAINKFDIGYIFQNYQNTLLPWKKIIDNIALPLQFRGEKKETRHKKVRSLLQQFSINLDLEKYPYQISGGQQQLVSILQNIIYKPNILLMDESLSSLDISVSLEIQNILQNMWLKRRPTILFISHDIDESIYLANRILVLESEPLGIAFDIPNPLAYPRNDITLVSQEYSSIRTEVQNSFLQVLLQK